MTKLTFSFKNSSNGLTTRGKKGKKNGKKKNFLVKMIKFPFKKEILADPFLF